MLTYRPLKAVDREFPNLVDFWYKLDFCHIWHFGNWRLVENDVTGCGNHLHTRPDFFGEFDFLNMLSPHVVVALSMAYNNCRCAIISAYRRIGEVKCVYKSTAKPKCKDDFAPSHTQYSASCIFCAALPRKKAWAEAYWLSAQPSNTRTMGWSDYETATSPIP